MYEQVHAWHACGWRSEYNLLESEAHSFYPVPLVTEPEPSRKPRDLPVYFSRAGILSLLIWVLGIEHTHLIHTLAKQGLHCQ